jgi:hypothetical protein
MVFSQVPHNHQTSSKQPFSYIKPSLKIQSGLDTPDKIMVRFTHTIYPLFVRHFSAQSKS